MLGKEKPGLALGPNQKGATCSIKMSVYESLPTVGFALGYIVVSGSLIIFNKYLMHADRFPYSIALTTLHMWSCFTMLSILYLIRPSLFPTLSGEREVVKDKLKQAIKLLIPVSMFFAGNLVLSNEAYFYSSVAFLQFMKEATLIVVFLCALLAGVERWNWSIAKVLLFVFLATTASIVGEIRFVWIGFFTQLCSMFCEGGKIVLQSVLLDKRGLKFDCLSFVLLITPLCGTVLLIQLLAFQSHALVWTAMAANWPLLVANVLVACTLNIVVAFLIKVSSATSYMIAGVVKDMCIVLGSCLFFREPIALLQMFSFFFQLVGVFTYGIVRTFPNDFKNRGLFEGLHSVYLTATMGDPKIPEESKPLIQSPHAATPSASKIFASAALMNNNEVLEEGTHRCIGASSSRIRNGDQAGGVNGEIQSSGSNAKRDPMLHSKGKSKKECLLIEGDTSDSSSTKTTSSGYGTLSPNVSEDDADKV